MTDKLLRGRVLNFKSEPQGADDTSAFDYFKDGAILIRDGVIAATGLFDDVIEQGRDAEMVDHRPNLLMAGFIDTHLHFPQVQVLASWGEQLLDWLNNYTFPEETRFVDPEHAARMATAFYDELTGHGTTTAVAYCSVHSSSVEAYFSEAERRNMRMLGGKVMMDRNAPEELTDTPQSSYDDSKMLLEKWHGKGRAGYVISPRFAITSTPQQMEAAQALVAEHPDVHVQTHMSENLNEIAYTKELYPDAPDYMGIYEHYRLLGPKILLGHCIHLEDREIGLMAETGSHPVFCPTSNLFLGSGLFDDAGLRARGISNGIATDIGGGTSYSMLQTLNEGYKVLQLRRQQTHAYRAFWWVTRGNAEVLGLEDKIGTLNAGTEADVVVLDACATSAMALRMERVETLAEELFVLQIMGDDRAIAQTYVAGEAQK
ncbi:MAG: guanine deaminase [Rhodobacteraceae bacterium]|nr:guanine deaminase [Paracoccaceae bacterium]